MAANWKLLNRVWHANLGMVAVISLGIIALSCPFIAHDWDAGKFLVDIHYGKFLPKETRWIWIDSQGLLLGFLVISGFLMHRKSVKKAASTAADDPAVAGSSVTIIGAEGGGVLASQAEKRGLRAFGCAADKASGLDLTHERWLVLLKGSESESFMTQLTALKPGSLKRLEYALEPGLDGQALDQALRAAGAKPMRVAEGDDAWADRVLRHLCAQSPSLKQRPANAPAAAPRVAAAAGFSLIEVIVALGVLSIMVAVGVSTFASLRNRDHVNAAAQEFAAMVREARQIARRENVMVRLAFNSREAELARPGSKLAVDEPLRHACSLFVFRIPAQQITSAVIAQPTRTLDASPETSEALLLGRVPLIEPLIGGWTPVHGYENWLPWSPQVEVEGEVLSAFASDPKAASKRFSWQPSKHWKSNAGTADTNASRCSPYPEDFSFTPFPRAREVVMKVLDASLTVEIPHAGSMPATDVWGTAPVPQWSDSAANHRSFALPLLDFLPNGELAFREREQIEFRFHTREGKPAQSRVLIRTQDAAVTIL